MKGLLTTNIIAPWIGYGHATRIAMFIESDRTGTSVLNLFNLIGRRLIVMPCIYRLTVLNCRPITFLAAFFFTCKQSNDNYGNGNGYSFHIHKILIMVGFCKSKGKAAHK